MCTHSAPHFIMRRISSPSWAKLLARTEGETMARGDEGDMVCGGSSAVDGVRECA